MTDLHNHRVQVFTAEGKFIRMFGRRGQDKGQLADPWTLVAWCMSVSVTIVVSQCSPQRVGM